MPIKSSLQFVLSADSAALEKDLQGTGKRIEKTLNGVQKKSRKTGRRMKRDFEVAAKGARQLGRDVADVGDRISGLAGVVGVAGLGALVKNVVESTDEMLKFSDSVGISIERLQGLEFAANQSGVPVNKLRDSLKEFNLRIGEARAFGTGEAVEPLKAIFGDLETALFKANGELKTNDELLAEVSDALASVTDTTKRAALSQKLFSEAGISAQRVFSQGADAIDEFQKKAEKLGLIIPRELAEEAVKLNDELGQLASIIGTKLSVAVLEFGPQIREVIVAIKEFVSESEGLGNNVVTVAKVIAAVKFASIATNILFAAGAMAKAASAAGLLAVGLRSILFASGVGAVFAALTFAADKFTQSIGGSGDEVSDLEKEIENLKKQTPEDLAPKFEKVTKAADDSALAVRRNSIQVQELIKEQEKVAAEAKRNLENTQKEVDSVLEGIDDAIAKVRSGPEITGFAAIPAGFTEIRGLIDKGDAEKALDVVNRTKDKITELKDEGELSGLQASGFLKQLRQLAVESGDALKAQREDALAQAEAELAQLRKSAIIEPEIQAQKVKDDAIKLREDLEKFLGEPLNIPVEINGVPIQDNRNMREDGSSINRFASGGFVRGPGTKTSDSVPALLSRGEFVVRAAAVDQYGVGLLRAINNMQFPTKLPKYAQGGPVGRPVNLNVAGHSFAMSASNDVVADLQRHVRMQALAQGRRT